MLTGSCHDNGVRSGQITGSPISQPVSIGRGKPCLIIGLFKKLDHHFTVRSWNFLRSCWINYPQQSPIWI